MPTTITATVHCPRCLEELPDGWQLREWTRVECGFVPDHGFQIWCVRHDMQVVLLKLAPGWDWYAAGDFHERGN